MNKSSWILWILLSSSRELRKEWVLFHNGFFHTHGTYAASKLWWSLRQDNIHSNQISFIEIRYNFIHMVCEGEEYVLLRWNIGHGVCMLSIVDWCWVGEDTSTEPKQKEPEKFRLENLPLEKMTCPSWPSSLGSNSCTTPESKVSAVSVVVLVQLNPYRGALYQEQKHVYREEKYNTSKWVFMYQYICTWKDGIHWWWKWRKHI